MKKSMSRLHLTYGIYLSLLCCTSTQGQTAPNITGYGGETTLFTCPIAAINPGDNYILLKDSTAFYDNSDNGDIIDGKYNATAGNGEIKLQILNTNISDAGKYTCSHNFIDTSGYVSVAFRPEKITTVTTMLTNGWQLTTTATKVFPNVSAISSVICLKPDNASVPFGSVGQSVNPNSDIPYLFDISWDGTITEHLSGQFQCTITLVTIETIVRTIVVSFQDTSTSTNSTPNSTSATVPPTLSTTTQIIQNTTDSTPDDCKICVWCVITPWWLCILLIVLGILGGGCIVGAIVYKCCIDKPPTWPCSSSKHNDDNSNSSVSQVKMDIMSTEKSDVDHKELSRNKSDGSDETENRPLSTTVETTNETSPETKSLQSTKHDGSQVNNQVVQTEGASPSPIKKGHSKVGPDDNQRSGDPEKNTAGSIREVNNERINTPRPLPILPKIGSKESSQAPNMGDVEANKPKKKKKKKKGKETKEDQIV